MKEEGEYDLSEEYILECTTKYTKKILEKSQESSCQGGYVDYSGKLMRVNGAPLEADYPYLGSTFTNSGFPKT